MILVLALIDIIFPISIIVLALCRIANVSIKWYVINLLAAHVTASIGRNVAEELGSSLNFDGKLWM